MKTQNEHNLIEQNPNPVTDTPVKRGVGRPKGQDGKVFKIDWSKATNVVWPACSDKEIALKLGCSVVAVFLRRKKMIIEGKDYAVYTKPKFTRARAKFLKAK